MLGPLWRFRQATTRDPCGNVGLRLSVPLNRTNVMAADYYAYDVPRSVCWDGVQEHCVATCMRAESSEYHSEPSYWLQKNAMGWDMRMVYRGVCGTAL